MDAFNDQNRPLEPDQYYHIYNRGNHGSPIFFGENNYRYFLSQYEKYLGGYVDTFAYCLLPNHFHFFVRIRSANTINVQAQRDFPDLEDLENRMPHKIVSERFRRFFLSYSNSINKQEGLSGSLFKKYFHRKRIDSDVYFIRLIYYIHTNSLHHELPCDWKTYPWTSFRFQLFGGKKEFLYYHQQKRDPQEKLPIFIED